MFEDYQLKCVALTRDDVLATLVEWHRHQAQNDPEADADAVLTLSTTVSEWRDACDLVAWQKLGRWLNEAFSIDVPDEQWAVVLTPPKHRPLADVCEIIARNATRAVAEPLVLLGRPCCAAGAFLAMRAILRDAGADVSRLAPSSELAPLLRSHGHVFVTRIAPLAPGALPPLSARPHPLSEGLTWVGSIIWLAMLASWFLSLGVTWLMGTTMFVAWLGSILASRWGRSELTFPGLRTFRDLALTLARERTGAFPVQPTGR